MIKDIDEDGNGALDVHEFKQLLERMNTDFGVRSVSPRSNARAQEDDETITCSVSSMRTADPRISRYHPPPRDDAPGPAPDTVEAGYQASS